MLAFFIFPALLGLGLIVSLNDDDDDDTGATNTIDQPDGTDVLEGTEGADRLSGNETGSEMLGFGGDDIILGNGGNDLIDAGTGDDTVFGGTGGDFVIGGEGDDRVFLGDGNDIYAPGPPLGALYDSGDDFVRGGNGDDQIDDSRGANTLFGDLGNDSLVAFDGLRDFGVLDPIEQRTVDTLSGGSGNDTLAGDFGDLLTGGAGADTFITLDDEDPALEEIFVTDFETDEDNLVIATLFGLAEPASIRLEFDGTLDAVRASYEGRDVAILEGLTASDIPDIDIAVIPFRDL